MCERRSLRKKPIRKNKHFPAKPQKKARGREREGRRRGVSGGTGRGGRKRRGGGTGACLGAKRRDLGLYPCPAAVDFR